MFYSSLYNLSNSLFEGYLQQVIFRLSFVFIIAFAIAYIGIKFFISFIHKKHIYQPIRDDIGLQTHVNEKKKTPTMGGIFIILGTLISTLLFATLENNYVVATLFVMISFAAIGFIDDYLKVAKKNTKGFKGSIKLVIQFTIVGAVLLFLQNTNSLYLNGEVAIPFTKMAIDLGVFYVFFATLVIVGAANAVNLTDGLDGLVSVPAIVALICFIVIAYIAANSHLAARFCVININAVGQLIIFCTAMIGAILAFLKFNIKPAKIFMGDVGSLAIGASLGVLAIILKKELLFGIIGLLFVIEAVSVILQVGSYKLRKKRIFLMAPIHHHFEKLGWGERKVVRVFWAASLLFAGIAMSSFLVK